jgi:hypothetical protein
MSVQIPQKQEDGALNAALQSLSSKLGGEAIETPLPAISPAMPEAPLQTPALSPEENMARALKRVEAQKFYEKIKQAKDSATSGYLPSGIVFSTENNPSDKK